jgi:predicted Zn-dependent protease
MKSKSFNFLKKKLSLLVIIIGISLFTIISCGKVMITGRNQVLLFSQGELTSLSEQAYTELMSKSEPSVNRSHINMVKKVGQDLTQAVERYVKQNGWEKALEGITWKFDVVKSDQVNAFCLPNGNIVFYEGIMKITNTPDLVAVVMGHEIAHALAKHGNERMSQEVLVGAAGQAISAYLGSESQKTQMIFGLAFGVGTQLGVLLPYSRKHEYEADRLGLIIMAMAGYDINVAPGFWEKMSAGGNSKLEFFSTHPSDANRIAQIKKVLPEAATYNPKK